MHQAHQPSPTKWLVAVARIPWQAIDQSGYFFASSNPSQSLTPVQRAQTAVVGCAWFGRHQPCWRASTAATPEASTTQRAKTLLVFCCQRTSSTWLPPGTSWTLVTLAG